MLTPRNQSLFLTGCQLKAQFKRLMKDERLKLSESFFLFKEEAEKFHLWASNLGLYHDGHASLDWRFRDAPIVYEYTSTVLSDVSRSLEKVMSEVADKPQFSEANPQEDDLSDKDSSDSDLDDYNDSLRSNKSQLVLILSNLAISIKSLYRLASQIQDRKLRAGFTKARKYKEVDEDTSIDLMNEYFKWDYKYVSESLHHLRGDSNAPEWLIHRLSTANCERRKQFRSAQHHHNKMQATHSLQDADAITLSAPTTVTRLSPERVNIDDIKSYQSTLTYIKFSQDPEFGELRIPALPTQVTEGPYFECPLCFVICRQKTGIGAAWSNHVLHDLWPYVCTISECNDGSELYDSFTDWVAHEQSSHLNYFDGERRSECPICLKQSVTAYHVAFHLQQLALFCLPTSFTDGNNDDENHEFNSDRQSAGSEPYIYSMDDQINAEGTINPAKLLIQRSFTTDTNTNTEMNIDSQPTATLTEQNLQSVEDEGNYFLANPDRFMAHYLTDEIDKQQRDPPMPSLGIKDHDDAVSKRSLARQGYQYSRRYGHEWYCCKCGWANKSSVDTNCCNTSCAHRKCVDCI